MMKNANKLYVVAVSGLLCSLMVAFAGAQKGYPAQNITVEDSSTQIAPAVKPLTITTRDTSTVYTVGAYVNVYSNGTTALSTPIKYWCVTAGTSSATNLYNWSRQADITDGTAVFRPIVESREEIVIQNDSSSVIYLALDAAAVLNKGIRLNANGGTVTISDYAGAIYGISADTNRNVCIQER